MAHVLRAAPLFAALALLGACASVRPAADEPAASAAGETTTTVKADEEGSSHEGRSIFTSLLLYIPNRVVDILDIARVGVAVGPGIGVDAQVTDPVSVVAMTRTYVGVGYQTLRHSPVVAGAEAGVGVGPLTLKADPGGWYRSSTDVRVGVHAAIVGAHVAVEPVEILDAVLGFLFIDIKGDDF